MNFDFSPSPGCREEEAVGKVGGGKVAAGPDGPQGKPAQQQGGEEARFLQGGLSSSGSVCSNDFK